MRLFKVPWGPCRKVTHTYLSGKVYEEVMEPAMPRVLAQSLAAPKLPVSLRTPSFPSSAP